MKKIISTTNAPSAIGPYSQAVQAGNTLYISGQLPTDPKTGEFAGNDAASQAVQSLEKNGFRSAVLEAMDACARKNRKMSAPADRRGKL